MARFWLPLSRFCYIMLIAGLRFHFSWRHRSFVGLDWFLWHAHILFYLVQCNAIGRRGNAFAKSTTSNDIPSNATEAIPVQAFSGVHRR